MPPGALDAEAVLVTDTDADISESLMSITSVCLEPGLGASQLLQTDLSRAKTLKASGIDFSPSSEHALD